MSGCCFDAITGMQFFLSNNLFVHKNFRTNTGYSLCSKCFFIVYMGLICVEINQRERRDTRHDTRINELKPYFHC